LCLAFFLVIFRLSELGKLTIRSEAKADTRDLFCVTFNAANLVNKEGFFSKSDPFLVFLRCNEDGSYSRVWESSVVMNSLNPRWGQMKLSMSTVCNGDIHRPLRIEIYDYEKSGKHVFMGQINELSIAQFVENRNLRLNVIEPEKQKKNKNYVNSGVLSADDCMIEKHYTFTQFIQGTSCVSLQRLYLIFLILSSLVVSLLLMMVVVLSCCCFLRLFLFTSFAAVILFRWL
jgi:hypothetical protein